MFCENCGKEIKNGDTNCPNCGYKVEIDSPKPIITKTSAKLNENTTNKRVKKIVLIGFLVLVALIVLIVIIFVSNNNFDNTNSSSYGSYETDYDSSYDYTETETEQIENVNLTELDYLYKDDDIQINNTKNGTANTGETYSNYMFSSSPCSMVSYRLGGQYDKLSAIWCICSTNKNTKDKNSFIVYVDNKLVFESSKLTGGDLPQQIDVDLNYGQLLTIMFDEGEGAGELGNIVLSCSDVNSAKSMNPNISAPVWLTSLDYLLNDNVTVNNDSNYGNTGKYYSHYLYASVDEDSEERPSITYYLDGEYSNLSGIWSICQQNKNSDSSNTFCIYVDENKIYSSNSITGGDEPQGFSIDINNCTKLKIEFSSGDGSAELGNIVVF